MHVKIAQYPRTLTGNLKRLCAWKWLNGKSPEKQPLTWKRGGNLQGPIGDDITAQPDRPLSQCTRRRFSHQTTMTSFAYIEALHFKITRLLTDNHEMKVTNTEMAPGCFANRTFLSRWYKCWHIVGTDEENAAFMKDIPAASVQTLEWFTTELAYICS
jgi:hypothetical protein